MEYQKCIYRGKEVFIREVSGNKITLMTRDGYWAEEQADWESVDKFAWEKSVDRDEIQIANSE